MRKPLIPVLVLCSLALAACGGGKKFVKPVTASVEQDPPSGESAQYKDGYLRIFVTSNLDETGRMLDFGDEGERPAKLLISARFDKGTIASFSSDSEPEIPVLLYDIQSNSVESSVVDNALLTAGMLVDPESLSKSPHLQIIVRGVPPDKAKWVTQLLAAGQPVAQVGLSLVPGAAAFNPISYKLGGMLSEEIKTSGRPWEEKTLLGLRADQGVDALQGRQFVVLLNPSKVELEAPPALARCKKTGAVTGLCKADTGEPWTPEQAYVRFELDVTHYRSIKDFLGSDLSCDWTERNWVDYRSLIGSGQLARLQTDYEQYLAMRGDLLMQVRRGLSEQSVQPYPSRVLSYAQQFSMLPRPEDVYWQQHFRNRAEQIEGCIRSTALRGQSNYAAIWDTALPIFRQAASFPAWAERLRKTADPESPLLLEAERSLAAIDNLLAFQELRSMHPSNLVPLTQPKQQLQRMLEISYRNMLDNMALSSEPPEGKMERILALQLRTRCAPCRALMQQRHDALQASLPLPPPPPPIVAPAPHKAGATPPEAAPPTPAPRVPLPATEPGSAASGS